MSDTVFDGMYTPEPGALRSGSWWPWVVAAAGAAIVTVGGVAFSASAELTPREAPAHPASLVGPAAP